MVDVIIFVGMTSSVPAVVPWLISASRQVVVVGRAVLVSDLIPQHETSQVLVVASLLHTLMVYTFVLYTQILTLSIIRVPVRCLKAMLLHVADLFCFSEMCVLSKADEEGVWCLHPVLLRALLHFLPRHLRACCWRAHGAR